MKYCAYCGSSMEDTDAFCPNCGAAANKPEANEPATDTAEAANEQEAPAQQTVTYENYTPTAPAGDTAEQDKAANTAMVLAIVGAAITAVLGSSLTIFSIAGLVISIIAVVKTNAAKQMGCTGGKFKAANIISKIALVASAILTVINILQYFVND